MTVTNVTGNSVSGGRDLLKDHANDPDAHHPQAHLLFGPDQSDVDTSVPMSDNQVLASDGGVFKPDRRTKMHFQPTQPLDEDSLPGDIWVLT